MAERIACRSEAGAERGQEPDLSDSAMWTPPRRGVETRPQALHTIKPGDNSPLHLGSIVSSVFTLVLAKHFKSFNRVGPGLRGSHQQGRRTSSNPLDPVRTLAQSRRLYIRVAGDEFPFAPATRHTAVAGTCRLDRIEKFRVQFRSETLSGKSSCSKLHAALRNIPRKSVC